MPSRAKSPVTPEVILADLATPPHLTELAHQLRALIRDLVPDVEEAGYPGWKLIGYRHGQYFGFIAPVPDEIRLGFEHGATLPDPHQVLRGKGKQVRYIPFRTPDDLTRQHDAIKELIQTAAFRAKYD
ncbi:MAG TPA: DUF1801 domain-containing protein [Phototrophicaceae bacterium]|nr:DUF1801 domain-containing protein [Phototrophicaceae bacterium]